MADLNIDDFYRDSALIFLQLSANTFNCKLRIKKGSKLLQALKRFTTAI